MTFMNYFLNVRLLPLAQMGGCPPPKRIGCIRTSSKLLLRILTILLGTAFVRVCGQLIIITANDLSFAKNL